MSLDVLWAGWRMEYIRKASAKGKDKRPCLFCAKARVRPGPRNLVVARTKLALVMLNLYPYNVGHVMVATRRHTPSLADVTREESVEIAEWLGRLETALAREYKPHGFNIGINLGRVAGAGVLGHLHWHIVPRFDDDRHFPGPIWAAPRREARVPAERLAAATGIATAILARLGP